MSEEEKKIVQNPDVILRDEDPDGALLFNPDSDYIKVINNTGLFIWKLLAKPQSLESILSNVKESFDNVPDDQLVKDVQKFVDEMSVDGFIGILEVAPKN